MIITCTGRKVNLKDSFEQRVQTRLGKLDKFFADNAEAQVTVTVEKDWQTVEITVKDKAFICRAEKSAQRMEDAFDDAADLLERRIVKNRKKLTAKMQSAALELIPDDEPIAEQELRITREKRFIIKPCMVEEAILEMELLGHSFFMFRDGLSGEINVVYRRKDGTYGLLAPEA